jgi:hypothetical protein
MTFTKINREIPLQERKPRCVTTVSYCAFLHGSDSLSQFYLHDFPAIRLNVELVFVSI